MSTEEERPSKVAQTRASRNTRRLVDIPVLRRHGSEDKEFKVEQLVKMRDVRDGAALPLP